MVIKFGIKILIKNIYFNIFYIIVLYYFEVVLLSIILFIIKYKIYNKF